MVSGYVQGKYAHYHYGYDEGRFSIFAGTEKEKGIPLVSVRDSVREAERHIGTFRLKPGMLAVVAGVSHLPLLELLYEQMKSPQGQGGWILAFEADTALYMSLKKFRPDLFAEIAVIVPENAGVMAELVEKIDVESFVGYRVFESAAAVGMNPTYYANVITDFKKKLASRFSDLFTRLEFEERWVFNALSKLPQCVHARPVSALFGLGKGKEALLVSTGPSLRHTLPFLQKNPERYFIACADSAYRVLHRVGIVPHLIFSLDSQAHTTKHFTLLPKGLPNAFPLLVCDAVSNPVVARDWQGELAISFTAQYASASPLPLRGERKVVDEFSSDTRVSELLDGRIVSPGCDFIEDEGYLEGVRGIIPGDLQSGGSVATSIFDLLRLMDFDKIILLGQDLAYTQREIHTPGTHHTDEWLSKTTNRLQSLENINERVLHRRHTKREISITGKPIVTDYILSLYRDWFAHAVEQLPQRVYNATYDGLLLKGAIPYRDEFIQAMQEGPSTAAANDTLLEKYLAAPTLGVNQQKVQSLAVCVESALASNAIDTGTLSFLRYVGRRFQIKAQRTPEMSAPLLKKQTTKQRNFLRKLLTKLYPHA
ncbi:MAG TPA: DUF115 domain-containing protein [Turneriella sp.]|nr:DUF115 domain-containing protein [Turneriella sp.]